MNSVRKPKCSPRSRWPWSLTAALPAAQHARACSGRRISGSSSRRIATSGSSPKESWTCWGSATRSFVADLGAGSGWFTVRLARSRRSERSGLRRRHPASDDSSHQSSRRSHGPEERENVLGTMNDPQLPVACRRGPHGRRVPRNGAAGRAVAQRGEVVETQGPHLHHQFHEGGRRTRGPRWRTAWTPEDVIRRRAGRGTRPARARNVPQVSIHAGVDKPPQ